MNTLSEEHVLKLQFNNPVSVFVDINKRLDDERNELLATELDFTIARSICNGLMLCCRYNDKDTREVFMDILGRARSSHKMSFLIVLQSRKAVSSNGIIGFEMKVCSIGRVIHPNCYGASCPTR